MKEICAEALEESVGLFVGVSAYRTDQALSV